MTISKEDAKAIWQKNLNLSKDICGQVNRIVALRLTHGDIESVQKSALTHNGQFHESHVSF